MYTRVFTLLCPCLILHPASRIHRLTSDWDTRFSLMALAIETPRFDEYSCLPTYHQEVLVSILKSASHF